MSERKPEWALNLSTKLKRWLPEHGYKTSVQLADELDIPKGVLHHIAGGSAIMTGEGHGKQKFDGRFFYARLNLWTGLAEADPRTIPDRLIRTSNIGPVIRTKSRNWSEDEYQQWLNSPEAQELLAKKNARIGREITMESATGLQPSEVPQQVEQSQTVGSFIGSFIDDLIDRGADQIARRLLEESQTDTVLPQIAGLEQKITTLESTINRLIQSQVNRVPPSQPRTSRTSDIGQLASYLRNLLDGYKTGTSEDRDKLMKNYGRDLMDLDMIVHTLTRRTQEREQLLKLNEEINQ